MSLLRISAVVATRVLLVVAAAWASLYIYQGEGLQRAPAAPLFLEVEVPFAHAADLEGSLPFAAAAAFDFDGDGRDELFLGGGRNQPDAVFGFRDGRFVVAGAVAAKAGPDATMGAAAIDLNGDGRDELLLARESGIWLCENAAAALACRDLELTLDASTTPLSIALGDVNRDGAIDFYVSGYIRKDLVDGETVFRRAYGGVSALFVADGAGAWRDATAEYGLLRQHNTFTALFADLDNDGDSDLVVAQDTGHVEMYDNRGAPPFAPIENPSVYSYPMGIAAGDLDNDGLIDLYFSNVGHTLPAPMLRGDLDARDSFNPDYMLFRNQGALRFADDAREAGLARLGFGWGVVFADVDLDGRSDVLVAQNYVRLPLNPVMRRYQGKLLLQQADGSFASAPGVENPAFGQTPIVGDFNGDGRPDIVWANINGAARAFLNQGPTGNAISVRLPNTAASINARIEVRVGARRLFGQVIANQGIGSDQSRTQIFGLGRDVAADTVTITLQDGRIQEFQDVPAGAVIGLAPTE